MAGAGGVSISTLAVAEGRVTIGTNSAPDHGTRGTGMRQLRIIEVATGGWDVVVEIDGHVIFSKHCNDWHRVERALRVLRIRFTPAACAA